MKQLVVSPENIQGEIVLLDLDQQNYLIKVRRMPLGQQFKVLVEGQGQRLVILKESETLGFHLVLTSEAPQLDLSLNKKTQDSPQLVLYISWLKSGKMDALIRSLVEIGVNRISPVHLSHCVGGPGERLEKKIARWQKIAREATQQSGRPEVPKIKPILSLEELLEDAKKNHSNLFFHQTPLAKGSLHGYLSAYSPEIGILVGPEGGLSTTEVDWLLKDHWSPVFLPMPVLRAETAVIVAAATVQIISQERESWKTRESQV